MEILNILFLANAGAAPATPAAETKAEAPAEKPKEKADETKKEATTTKNANDGQIEEG